MSLISFGLMVSFPSRTSLLHELTAATHRHTFDMTLYRFCPPSSLHGMMSPDTFLTPLATCKPLRQKRRPQTPAQLQDMPG